MEEAKPKATKKSSGLIIKTWERCKAIGRGQGGTPRRGLGPKSLSWPGGGSKQTLKEASHLGPPEGYFSVYVGPEKQKFMVKAEQANHPLFRVLLEEAEAEFGYNKGGPMELPCKVDVFSRVLVEIDSNDDGIGGKRHGCGFVKGYVGAYRLLSPSHKEPPEHATTKHNRRIISWKKVAN